MSSRSRLPEVKSTCKMWFANGFTAEMYFRCKLHPPFPEWYSFSIPYPEKFFD